MHLPARRHRRAFHRTCPHVAAPAITVTSRRVIERSAEAASAYRPAWIVRMQRTSPCPATRRSR